MLPRSYISSSRWPLSETPVPMLIGWENVWPRMLPGSCWSARCTIRAGRARSSWPLDIHEQPDDVRAAPAR